MAEANEPVEPRSGRDTGRETGGSDEPETQPLDGDAEPTAPVAERWKGSASVPPLDAKRRRRGVLREPTAEMPIVEDDDDGWPPPPPPRPPNAPVTAPYPPPQAYPARRQPPAPPRWTPPAYPPVGYRRRRRKWPWVLAVMFLLTAVCCGCCVNWVKPFFDEYPAAAALPPQAVNLVKLDDPATVAETTALQAKIRMQHWFAEEVFAGVYAEPRTRQRPVVIFGATLFLLDPEADLKDGFTALTGELSLTDIRAVPPGPAGGHQRCAVGTNAGAQVSVCGWADHGSMAIGVFSGRTVDQSAELLRQFRAAIISR